MYRTYSEHFGCCWLEKNCVVFLHCYYTLTSKMVFIIVFAQIVTTGMLDRHWETDMERAQDRSGWTNYDVLVERLTFSTVVTMVGVYTIADITRMFLSVAAALRLVMHLTILNVLTDVTVLSHSRRQMLVPRCGDATGYSGASQVCLHCNCLSVCQSVVNVCCVLPVWQINLIITRYESSRRCRRH